MRLPWCMENKASNVGIISLSQVIFEVEMVRAVFRNLVDTYDVEG